MKLVYFNQFRQDGTWVNTWQAWNKQYLQSLNAKITSLQDYIIYNSPEYIVFNSPYNENPIDLIENKLQEDISWNGTEKEQQISLFYPTRLSWRQGFYNQSQYGDGLFVFPKQINNETYYLINWHEDDIYYAWQTDQWYSITEQSENDYQVTSIIFDLPPDAIDFPSGYICILNKQPIGIDNETNSIKKSLDSYLIAPIGNGAYYTLDFSGSDLIAKYTKNDLNNFIDQIRINLSQNLRYFLKDSVYIMGVNSLDKKGGAFALSNIGMNNSEIVDIITDHYGNLWTGGDELVAQTVHHSTKEEIFMDVAYDTYASQLKRNMVHNFNISTTEDIADIETTDQKIISMIQLQLF